MADVSDRLAAAALVDLPGKIMQEQHAKDAAAAAQPQSEEQPRAEEEEHAAVGEAAAAPFPAHEDEDDDDENETCGFCKFMKGGGCKQAFIDWSTCVDRERDAGGDFTEECRDATLRLRQCMLANRDYYAPLLEEEEAMAREAAAEAEAAAVAVGVGLGNESADAAAVPAEADAGSVKGSEAS